ncbi:MAG: hypothetical protein ACHQ5A_02150 [Opitutales bacterium]
MSSLLRNLLALLSGALAAGVIIIVIETMGAMAYPPPPGFDPRNAAAMRIFIASLPVGAFLYILAAYLAGTFTGVFVATRFSLRRPARQGWLLGLVFLISGVVNFLKYPHPAWFVAASLAAFLGATWFGVRLGRPRLPA